MIGNSSLRDIRSRTFGLDLHSIPDTDSAEDSGHSPCRHKQGGVGLAVANRQVRRLAAKSVAASSARLPLSSCVAAIGAVVFLPRLALAGGRGTLRYSTFSTFTTGSPVLQEARTVHPDAALDQFFPFHHPGFPARG